MSYRGLENRQEEKWISLRKSPAGSLTPMKVCPSLLLCYFNTSSGSSENESGAWGAKECSPRFAGKPMLAQVKDTEELKQELTGVECWLCASPSAKCDTHNHCLLNLHIHWVLIVTLWLWYLHYSHFKDREHWGSEGWCTPCHTPSKWYWQNLNPDLMGVGKTMKLGGKEGEQDKRREESSVGTSRSPVSTTSSPLCRAHQNGVPRSSLV